MSCEPQLAVPHGKSMANVKGKSQKTGHYMNSLY